MLDRAEKKLSAKKLSTILIYDTNFNFNKKSLGREPWTKHTHMGCQQKINLVLNKGRFNKLEN